MCVEILSEKILHFIGFSLVTEQSWEQTGNDSSVTTYFCGNY